MYFQSHNEPSASTQKSMFGPENLNVTNGAFLKSTAAENVGDTKGIGKVDASSLHVLLSGGTREALRKC